MNAPENMTTPAIPFLGRAPWALVTGVVPLNLEGVFRAPCVHIQTKPEPRKKANFR